MNIITMKTTRKDSAEPHRILVPVHFSKSSLAALQHALALAR